MPTETVWEITPPTAKSLAADLRTAMAQYVRNPTIGAQNRMMELFDAVEKLS